METKRMKMEYRTHTCKICKKKFKSRATYERYCSDKCYKKGLAKPLGFSINGFNL